MINGSAELTLIPSNFI